MAEANQQPAGLPEEPVRVNHTVRNIIIAVVVVALVAIGAFFGVRAFNGSILVVHNQRHSAYGNTRFLSYVFDGYQSFGPVHSLPY